MTKWAFDKNSMQILALPQKSSIFKVLPIRAMGQKYPLAQFTFLQKKNSH